MNVSNVMTTDLKTAHAAPPLVKDIANTMCLNNINGLPTYLLMRMTLSLVSSQKKTY